MFVLTRREPKTKDALTLPRSLTSAPPVQHVFSHIQPRPPHAHD